MKKLNWLKATAFALGVLCFAPPVEATTYYVRPNGGTDTQCTGTSDFDYDGSGTGEACAFNSWAWLVKRSGTRLACGDTVILDDDSESEIGLGAPGIINDGSCFSGANYACSSDGVPDCTEGNEIKIYGRSYENCDGLGLTEKAQIWGSGRIYQTFWAGNNMDLQCVVITHHDDCKNVYHSPSAACDEDCGDGSCEGAYYGIWMNDKTGVNLKNVDVVGLFQGIPAQGAGDFTFTRVRSVANSSTGLSTDTPDDSNIDWTGDNLVNYSSFSWSGCGIHYPFQSDDPMSSTGKYDCLDQNQGSFADGFAQDVGGSVGNLTITNSEFKFNEQDAIDLLYNNAGTLYIARNQFEGNIGNAIKTGPVNSYIENNIIVQNCGFFDGQSFTSTTNTSGASAGQAYCRAGGDAVSINLGNGTTHRFTGNTVFSNGAQIILINGASWSSCGSGNTVIARNNILMGGNYYNTPSILSNYDYNDGTGNCTSTSIDEDYNVIWNVGEGSGAVTGANSVYSDPLFTGAVYTGSGGTYMTGTNSVAQFNINTGSPASNAADETVTLFGSSADANGFARGVSWDIGAFETDTTGGGGEDPCDTDCTQCFSGGACSSSALTCYPWVSGSPTCRATEETCTEHWTLCDNQTECEAEGWYYYDDDCNQLPQSCDSTCTACDDPDSCSASAQGCGYFGGGCIDIDTVTVTGSAPNWTISGSDYTVEVDGGDEWTGLKFNNSSEPSTDVILGAKYIIRGLGSDFSGYVIRPEVSPTALDINTRTLAQYVLEGDLKDGSATKKGETKYYVTFLRDRIWTRAEGRETVATGSTSSIRMAIDEDIRQSSGGATTLYADEYRYKESGGVWETESLDGTAPSSSDIALPFYKQLRFDTGATDGVWSQIALDLSNTNFATVTIEENNDYDDVTIYKTNPSENTWYAASVLHVFNTGTSYADSSVDTYANDALNPPTLENFDTGSLKTDAAGDTDADGFNERYGWSEVDCSVSGYAKFDLADDAYTRKEPVIRFTGASISNYIVKIGGTTKTEGTDYFMTTEADEAQTGIGSNVRILQLIGDYADGVTDLELSVSSGCNDDCGLCSDQTKCEASSNPCYYYNGGCSATPSPGKLEIKGCGFVGVQAE